MNARSIVTGMPGARWYTRHSPPFVSSSHGTPSLTAFVSKLGAKHLRQVEMYAVNEGVPWLLLRNGGEWRVYHLAPGMPVTIDLAFIVNLTDQQVPPATRIDRLFYLTKEAMKRDLIESLWKQQAATAPAQLFKALNAPAVIAEIRREIRKRSGQIV